MPCLHVGWFARRTHLGFSTEDSAEKTTQSVDLGHLEVPRNDLDAVFLVVGLNIRKTAILFVHCTRTTLEELPRRAL